MRFGNPVKRLFPQNDIKKYPDPLVNADCTEFEINNWIVSDFIIHELIPIVGSHPFPVNELFLLTASICRFKPDHIFEWGTNIGKSARIFYEITSHFQIPTQIHSIDLPDNINHIEHPGKKRGLYVKGLKNVTLYQGDGLNVSLDIYKRSQSITNPLFFLDGDHSFDSIKRESSGIITDVKDPVIIIHDTFYQSTKADYNIGPFKAIDELLKSNPDYKTISTNTGLPGLTVLFKKNNLNYIF